MEIIYRLKNLKIKRSFRFLYQRLTRGWDDSETWGLDHELAKHILPRLKRFKEVTNGYPNELTPESWDAILDEMIFAFQFYSTEKMYQWDSTPEEYSRVQKGLELFGKYYPDLWW